MQGENLEQKNNDNDNDFDKELMREMIRELAKNEPKHFGHTEITISNFEGDEKQMAFNVDELTDGDLKVFWFLKNRTLTPDIYKEYKNSVPMSNNPRGLADSRTRLLNYVNYQLVNPENQKWYDPETYELMEKIRNRKKEIVK